MGTAQTKKDILMFKHLIASAFALPLMTAPTLAEDLRLTLTLPEGDETRGSLLVGVFTSQEAFNDGEIAHGCIHPALPGDNQITLSDLPAGTYGISVFLDQNDNGELDRNLLGIPSEPYGFTRNPTIRFSAPGFNRFSFDYDGQGGEFTINLNGL